MFTLLQEGLLYKKSLKNECLGQLKNGKNSVGDFGNGITYKMSFWKKLKYTTIV